MMKEFDEILGYADIRAELEQICDQVKDPEKYRKLGVEPIHGLILEGPPGVGKTLMANCFIKASGRKSFVCRKDKPNGSFVESLVSIFNEAKAASASTPIIVFLDDLDKFSNCRSDSRNSDEFVTLQTCIDLVKNDDVFVIATANDTNSIPNSLLRAGRFDRHIDVNAPSTADAVDIVAHYLDKRGCKNINAEEVAKLLKGQSCAVLETIINIAGTYAAYENRQSVSMNDVVRSAMRYLFDAPFDSSSGENPYLRNTAMHEAAHCAVMEYLEPESVYLVTVEKTHGDIAGLTLFDMNEFYFYDKKFMENRVMTLLAGKAANELFNGIIDVGTSGDISRAHKIVARFVDDYCGFGFIYNEGENVSSEEMMARKEHRVCAEMENYYKKTKDILLKNRDFVELVTDELCKKRTLLKGDINQLKEMCAA